MRGFGLSQVQEDRIALTSQIVEQTADIQKTALEQQRILAEGQLALQKVRDEQRAKYIKYGMIGIGALLLIKVLNK